MLKLLRLSCCALLLMAIANLRRSFIRGELKRRLPYRPPRAVPKKLSWLIAQEYLRLPTWRRKLSPFPFLRSPCRRRQIKIFHISVCKFGLNLGTNCRERDAQSFVSVNLDWDVSTVAGTNFNNVCLRWMELFAKQTIAFISACLFAKITAELRHKLQGGTSASIIITVSANTIACCFSEHNCTCRRHRWFLSHSILRLGIQRTC